LLCADLQYVAFCAKMVKKVHKQADIRLQRVLKKWGGGRPCVSGEDVGVVLHGVLHSKEKRFRIHWKVVLFSSKMRSVISSNRLCSSVVNSPVHQ
jgi:hypothetical protein